MCLQENLTSGLTHRLVVTVYVATHRISYAACIGHMQLSIYNPRRCSAQLFNEEAIAHRTNLRQALS